MAKKIKKPVGRPRNPLVDRVLAIQTLRQLASKGYAALSISNIVEAAQVSKATFYRRYRNKRALVLAVLNTIVAYAPKPKDTGNFEDDLVLFADQTLRMIQKLKIFSTLSALVVHAKEDPRPLKLLQQHIILPRRQVIFQMLKLAQKRRQISAQLNLDLAVDAAMGSVFSRQITGLPMGKRWLKQTISQLVRGWQK